MWARMVLDEMPNTREISVVFLPCWSISWMILMSCFFMGNSPFEFAILCVIALARCPPYSGRDVTGPWGLFPRKLMRICTRSPVPLSPGKRPEDVTGPTPLGQKGQKGQISLPAGWGWSNILQKVCDRHPVLAPWVWVQCNRTHTDDSRQAGWILPS